MPVGPNLNTWVTIFISKSLSPDGRGGVSEAVARPHRCSSSVQHFSKPQIGTADEAHQQVSHHSPPTWMNRPAEAARAVMALGTGNLVWTSIGNVFRATGIWERKAQNEFNQDSVCKPTLRRTQTWRFGVAQWNLCVKADRFARPTAHVGMKSGTTFDRSVSHSRSSELGLRLEKWPTMLSQAVWHN